MSLPAEIPVEQFAIALIRRWFGEEPRWLVRLARAGREADLIEAPRLEGESFRESLDREIAWQLHLRSGRDYIISSVPRLHAETPCTRRLCSGEELTSLQIIEFYLVELFGAESRRVLDEDFAVQWWTDHELLHGVALRPLNARQRDLLVTTDLFPHVAPR